MQKRYTTLPAMGQGTLVLDTDEMEVVCHVTGENHEATAARRARELNIQDRLAHVDIGENGGG